MAVRRDLPRARCIWGRVAAGVCKASVVVIFPSRGFFAATAADKYLLGLLWHAVLADHRVMIAHEPFPAFHLLAPDQANLNSFQ